MTDRITMILIAVLSLFVVEPLSADQQVIRVATYNASLYGERAGQVHDRLANGDDRQAKSIAAIIQKTRPDVLLLNEVDFDSQSALATMIADKYFAVSQNGQPPMEYPYVWSVPSNTGVDSKLDLNCDGKFSSPNDAWGFGRYRGQYAMAVFSRYPLHRESVRTFQHYRWSELPNAQRPIDPETNASYYTDGVWEKLRLSSKNHVDLPIQINESQRIHLLACHPTPPVFDGSEDRNGCRNHDEIMFWVDYLRGDQATHIKDDKGTIGGIKDDALFVIAGDLNSDPIRGDGRRAAIQRLLRHPRIVDPQPTSRGGKGTTAKFGGGLELRVDFVLPCRDFMLRSSEVHWPIDDDHPSDHRLVWVDIQLPDKTSN